MESPDGSKTNVMLIAAVILGFVSLAVASFDDPNYWSAYDPGENGVGTDPDGFIGAVFDGRYVYFVPSYNGSGFHGEVMRYDTNSNFNDALSWTTYDPGANGVGNYPDGYHGAAFDGQYIYFVPYLNSTWYHGEVMRYDTNNDFNNALSWTTYDPGANGVGNDPDGFKYAAFDGRYIYFVPFHNGPEKHGEVLRYDTNGDFNNVLSWTTYDPGANGVGTDPDGFIGAVFDGRYVYFGPSHNGTAHHGEVLRYDTNGIFTDPSSWVTYDPGANGVGIDPDGFQGVIFDGRFVYFVPSHNGSGSNGEVLCYDTNGIFADPCSWAAYDPGSNGVGIDPDGYRGAVFDGRHVYFVPFYNGSGYHGEVLCYDTNEPFNDPCSWAAYDPGANGVGTDPDGYIGAAFDGRYVYFVPYYNGSGNHGEVLRFDTGLCRPDESDVDGDGVPDRCDICPADPCDECDPNGSTAEEIVADQGGTVETPDGALTIDVDPCDLSENATISVTQTIPQDPNVDLMIGPSPGLGVAVAVYDLKPDGLVFDNPITLTIETDVTHINPNLREKLQLYLWDDNEGKFVSVAGADCNLVEDPCGMFIKTCEVEIDHFSVFAMVAPRDSDNDGIPDLFGEEQDYCPELAPVDSTLSYTGDLLVAVNEIVSLSAVLTNEIGQPLADVPIDFTVTDSDGNPDADCSASTNQQGVAWCDIVALDPDVYTVTATSSELGCPAALVEALLVVFNPGVPRATGGGFILPDEQSTLPAQSSEDKANFGFIVRLDKNQATAGNLEFQYKTAGINLKSQSMEWYTVSNNKAMFEGIGTVNGQGYYTFRVRATDGNLTGDQPDSFNIKIWEGADTEIDPFHQAKNVLSGGNVVIHKK